MQCDARINAIDEGFVHLQRSTVAMTSQRFHIKGQANLNGSKLLINNPVVKEWH